MHPTGSFKRKVWLMDLADSVRTSHMALSLANWKERSKPTPIGKDQIHLSTKNLIKLVAGMIAKGMTKQEIQEKFGIDYRNTTRFWRLFLEWPESEQVDTFRWADRLCKQARFRIGDL